MDIELRGIELGNLKDCNNYADGKHQIKDYPRILMNMIYHLLYIPTALLNKIQIHILGG